MQMSREKFNCSSNGTKEAKTTWRMGERGEFGQEHVTIKISELV